MNHDLRNKGFSRRGQGILFMLLGTLIPLFGSMLASQIAPFAASAVSFAGYLLTIVGAAFLLPDTAWFAAAILCTVLGIAADCMPLVSENPSERLHFILTAVAIELCYISIYGGLNRLISVRNVQRMGQWWVALFAMSEVLMYVSLYIYPHMPHSAFAQLIGTVAASLCALAALSFQIRYFLTVRKHLQ